ncbi:MULTISPECIES: PDR/VanB family oxidoreductase [Alphaproteobacteria]|uniref:Oxidoreductase n=2 Tax=Alphaproteobacteria TaxID=28211 RepID=A0A512HNM4_9HYPH|nr:MULTISPECIES: PDR/VanB family oxidoreductase [Alphaproteobacteria]GEO87055.1 oxidoreductase [Ciceribacter naphthalenivorans]GLR23159.1 oxidoreductase [Ciceribacter naphthalenivorans]GLT06015.1 oxidoreductase [Sphingomonas psychrolutea]
MSEKEIPVRVRQIRYEANTIVSVEVSPLDGTVLPSFGPGAHIDLILSGSLRRSYSLYKPYTDGKTYSVAVHRDPESRGGSLYVHDTLRVGDKLKISAPKNNFPLREDAEQSVFIAGGIGITPMLCMLTRLSELGRRWTLHYAARSRSAAAFLDEIAVIADKGEVVCHFDDEKGGARMNLDAIFTATPTAHFYCCGPEPMLAAYEKAGQAIPREQLHVEYFSAREEAAREGGYEVELHRSGMVLEVPAGKSILDILIANNVSVPFACNDGVCGTCETRVLSGRPDHRDSILTDEERAACNTMMVCCSGSKSARLVLDI